LSQRNKALFDFNGNIMKGNMKSKTATRLVREWIDLRLNELEEDWQLARAGKEIKKIDPLE
jgi:predicted DNA-binding protein